jgi:hypothetical protein
MGWCPRLAWADLPILWLLHNFAIGFPSPFSVFLRDRLCFVAFFGSKALFLPEAKTPPPWFPLFPCLSDAFSLHPDVAVANLRRSMALRMDRNNSRGIATSAIWKITLRACVTTLAPILMSFSRKVVSVQ